MPSWWTPLTVIETEIDCGPAVHAVLWKDGRLHLPDHEDVEAERVLGALGGEVPACLRLRSTWERYSTDVALATLGRRPGDDSLGVSQADGRSVGRALADAAVLPPITRRRAELLALFSLPSVFVDRLVLTAFASAATEWAHEQFRIAHGLRYGAALTARAMPALRRFATSLPEPVNGTVLTCAPAAPGEATAIRAEETPDQVLHVNATLPVSWLAGVWGPGISEIDGALVLAVTGSGSDGDGASELSVEVAQWDQVDDAKWHSAARAAALVRAADGRWSLVKPNG